jgi:hypothetical protein
MKWDWACIFVLLWATFGSRAAQAQDFGLSGYTKEFWLNADNPKGDHTLYSNGFNISTGTLWADLSGQSNRSFKRAGGTDNRVKFTRNGFNYHPAFLWQPSGDADNVRLACASIFTQNASHAYYVFIVSNPSRRTTYRRTLFSLYPAQATPPTRSSISWGVGGSRENSNDLVYIGYRNGSTNSGADYAFTRNKGDKPYGLIGLNLPNDGTSITSVYLNGRMETSPANTNHRWTASAVPYIGNMGTDYLPYSGTIQEIIMLSKPENTAMPLADVQKIQTYLAIKYGLTLHLQSATDKYVSSTNETVWTYDPAYNSNIFGLARDDASGLYQKQSQSVDNSALKIFVGSSIEELNRENNGSIPDKQYLMFGHNGQTDFPSTTIAFNTPYENGNIQSDLNFQSGAIYKAQVTGTNSFTVNMQVGNSFSYALISTNDDFSPTHTRFYPVNALGIATVPLDNSHPYIRFAGYNMGPGGVGSNLKLWLRADDSNMLTIENTDITDETLGSGFPATEYPNVLHVPAVVQWSDYIRNVDYTFANTNNSNARKPVYRESSPEMNFHPAIRFYNVGSSSGSYVRSNTGILAYPNSAKHATIVVTNNDFSTNAWVYPITFGSQMGTYHGPQYGVEKSNGLMVGRLRMNTSVVVNGTEDLFKVGATSILHYELNHDIDTKRGAVTFRFNGKEEQVGYGPLTSSNKGGLSNNFDMDTYSIISGGYDENRIINGVLAEVIIFEGIMSSADITKITSYLAFKYGITIRPTAGTGRYDYVINDGNTMIWNGTQASGKYVTYYNNVAALVHDNASQLNNQQTHSTDQGSLLHMGVAGTELDGTHYNLGELQDGEAVAFGHDNAAGITDANVICGDFKKVFNRHWYVHKVTNNNRPINVLVGGEDNANNNLGKNATVADKAYYEALRDPQNRFFLLVASNPADLNDFENGNFKVVPMYYIHGEHQCNYAFTEEDSYITFAYAPGGNGSACTASVDFEGIKTFRWLSTTEQWKNPTHRKSGTASAGQTFSKPAVDLGDNISVVTSVKYDSDVRAPYGFPHTVNTPKDALEIRRTHGTKNSSKITVEVHFQTSDNSTAEPVIPFFSISGLDARGLSQYDEVTITGSCNGTDVLPKLTPAGLQPTFSIVNNTARVNKNQSKSATDKNGTVNIAFESSVTQITIVYKLTNVENALRQSIVISPISFTPGTKPLPVLPPINEDGIGFQKQVKEKTLTSCEEVEFTFYIQNTNRSDKYFKLQDVLPSGMTWKAESIGLGNVNVNSNSNSNSNSKLEINNYAENSTLVIDSIFVECAANIKISATAVIDELASSGDYPNRASLTYEHFKINEFTSESAGDTTIYSVDYDTHEANTIIHVIAAARAQPITVERTEHSPEKYSENQEIIITLEVNNPNTSVTNMFMNVDWGSNFSYVQGSLNITSSQAFTWVNVQPDPPYSTSEVIQNLFIAGNATGDTGFTLPTGSTTIVFKVKAPDTNNLDLRADGINVHPLTVSWDFFIDSPDACVQHAVENLTGEIVVPYKLDLYIDAVTDNIGPNTGGAYAHDSNGTNGTPVHWGINGTGTVTIQGGDRFLNAETITVLFGNRPATNVVVIDDNTLTCTPPAATENTTWNDQSVTHTYNSLWGYEGNVDVTLTVLPSVTETVVLEDSYTYRAPMTITGISPSWGTTQGGIEVSIIGHNFLLPNGSVPTTINVVFATPNTDAAPATATVNMTLISNNQITATNSAHKVNHTNVTVDNAWEKTAYASFTYFPTVFIANGNWTEYEKWEDHSNENILPYPQSDIEIKAHCVQNISVDMNSITVHPLKSYTVDVGKEVKANLFTLRDNASFLNYGTDLITNARVLHTLAKGRNWYVSSPVQNGSIPVIENSLGKDEQGNALSHWRVERYDEPSHQWQAASGTFANGRGYTAYSANEDIAAHFMGKFSDGNKSSLTLTRQNDAHPKRGFNLVGNPFPSYWRWTSAAAQAANLYSTIWYRTNVKGTYEGYQFWAYNAAGNVAVAPGWEDEIHGAPYSLAYIPPMQAFWVRIRDGQSGGTLPFANDRRAHADLKSNILKAAPVPEMRQLLRLVAGNGQQTDETLIYADAAATDRFDDYDSDKWFINQGVELFTFPESSTRELSINGRSVIKAGMEIPLGFQADEGGIFSFHAKEILNLDTLDVLLRDNWLKKEFDLRSNGSYHFTSGSTPNIERFSVVFRRSTGTGLQSTESNDHFVAYIDEAGQIVVEFYSADLPNSNTVSVFDVTGRKLTTQPIIAGRRTTLKGTFKEGAYMLRAGRWSAKVR